MEAVIELLKNDQSAQGQVQVYFYSYVGKRMCKDD